jgi:hypothetical protein
VSTNNTYKKGYYILLTNFIQLTHIIHSVLQECFYLTMYQLVKILLQNIFKLRNNLCFHLIYVGIYVCFHLSNVGLQCPNVGLQCPNVCLQI